MEVRHLRVVLVLAEELHFGRAAARLHVVQSAVSQTLKDLEEELGTELFARNRHEVALTAAGAHFRDHARRALEEIASGASAAQRAGRGEEGRLRIAFSIIATLTPLPHVVTAFMRENPRVQVELVQSTSPSIFEMLVHGEADVGVVPEIDHHGALSFSRLTTDPVVALLPRDHPFVKAKKKTIRPADLEGEALVVLSSRADPAIKAQNIALMSKYEIRPKVVYEFDQLETLLSLVAAGLALALVPSPVAELRYRQMVHRPVTPRMVARHFVAWDAKRLSPVALRFLTALRASARG